MAKRVFNPIVETFTASGKPVPEGELVFDLKGNEQAINSMMYIFDPLRDVKAREIRHKEQQRERLLSEYMQL